MDTRVAQNGGGYDSDFIKAGFFAGVVGHGPAD